MANFEALIPFIIKWETGILQQKNESLSELFERARKKGFANDPKDKGGATQTGVTIGTYTTYCLSNGKPSPTVAALKAMKFDEWKDIMKSMYWDKWQADKIVNQSIADICVDWVWASGKYGITGVQKLIGVKVDGVVGPKTLAALNSKPPITLWNAIKTARIEFVRNIVKSKPSQSKFLKGWLNRIYDFKYVDD